MTLNRFVAGTNMSSVLLYKIIAFTYRKLTHANEESLYLICKHKINKLLLKSYELHT